MCMVLKVVSQLDSVVKKHAFIGTSIEYKGWGMMLQLYKISDIRVMCADLVAHL